MTDASSPNSPSKMFVPMIVQGAQVLLPSGEIALRDVAIADGKITAVGTGLEVSADTRTVDGEGLTMLPGVIDPQVSFPEWGLDLDFELEHQELEHQELEQSEHQELERKADLLTESGAYVRGGVTSFLEMPFLEMPNTPPLTTTQPVLKKKLAIAAQSSLTNYGFFRCATAIHTAYPGCGILLSLGAEHSSFSIDSVEQIEPIFAEGDRPIALHTNAQDSETALSAMKLALKLARKYERRLHILHISTAEEVALLRADKPSWITAAVTLQRLLLATQRSQKPELQMQRNLPPKAERHHKLLWQALSDGIIDLIATGHTLTPATRNIEKGDRDLTDTFGAPGIPSAETALPLLLTQAKENRCSVAQVANWMSTAIARAYSIPKKGLIEPGYDADLVLVDLATYRPVLRAELKTSCGWSPFENWTLTGWPALTIVGGQIAYDRGRIDTNVRGRALQFGAN